MYFSGVEKIFPTKDTASQQYRRRYRSFHSESRDAGLEMSPSTELWLRQACLIGGAFPVICPHLLNMTAPKGGGGSIQKKK